MGEVKADLDDKPVFPALETGEGAVVLIDTTEAMLAHNLPGSGIGIQLPPGVTTVTALVQCLGDPVVVTPMDGEPAATLDCSDPATTHRVDLPGRERWTIHAGTEGLAWVRLAAEAVPGAASSRPGRARAARRASRTCPSPRATGRTSRSARWVGTTRPWS